MSPELSLGGRRNRTSTDRTVVDIWFHLQHVAVFVQATFVWLKSRVLERKALAQIEHLQREEFLCLGSSSP